MLGRHLQYLRCPATGQKLTLLNQSLVGGGRTYPINRTGVPALLAQQPKRDDRIQKEHYNKQLTKAYLKNLGYAHTKEYFRYLDNELKRIVGRKSLGMVLDLCCGHGEVEKLFGEKVELGFGVDISEDMLSYAQKNNKKKRFAYLQASGLELPFPNGVFDHVFCLGGIHHIPNQRALFLEIRRVLKRGGRLVFREPVDDFVLWRGLRKIIYFLSPKLDQKTERPVRRIVMEKEMSKCGLRMTSWRTKGFMGCALFMNSDVLVFNRFLRFLPGIRGLVRQFAAWDEALSRGRVLAGKGIQVLGEARKVR